MRTAEPTLIGGGAGSASHRGQGGRGPTEPSSDRLRPVISTDPAPCSTISASPPTVCPKTLRCVWPTSGHAAGRNQPETARLMRAPRRAGRTDPGSTAASRVGGGCTRPPVVRRGRCPCLGGPTHRASGCRQANADKRLVDRCDRHRQLHGRRSSRWRYDDISGLRPVGPIASSRGALGHARLFEFFRLPAGGTRLIERRFPDDSAGEDDPLFKLPCTAGSDEYA